MSTSGYEQASITSGSTVTVNRGSNMSQVWGNVESGLIRVRADGGAPTATVGELLGADFSKGYSASSIQIHSVSGTATIQTWSAK